jgi:hypothetical protein
MKKLLTIAIAALFPISATAQSFPLPTGALCSDMETSLKMIEKYDEDPMLLGDANIFTSNGQIRPGQMTLWFNSNTKSFTLMFTPQGTSYMCLMLSGQNLDQLYELGPKL